MKRVEKPWGYEEIWAKTNNYVGKTIVIRQGHRLSLQYHQKKEETIYVIDGHLRIWKNNNERDYVDYEPGSVYHVNPGEVHRFGAAYKDVKIVEVSTPELNDVIRLEDDYNR